jgi:hypothetical protein
MSNGAAKIVINSQLADRMEDLVPLCREFNDAIEAGKVSDDLADEAAPLDADALSGVLRALSFYRKWKKKGGKP